MQTFPIQMKLCPLHLERLIWICMSLILLSHQIAVLLNLIRWDIHAQVDKKLLLLLKVIIWFQRWEVVNKGDWNRNEWCIVSRAISYKSYMQKVSWPLFWLMQNYVCYYITLWTHLMTSCPAACRQLLPLLSSTNCICQTLSSRIPHPCTQIFTLPSLCMYLSTNKTKISRAALRVEGDVFLLVLWSF